MIGIVSLERQIILVISVVAAVAFTTILLLLITQFQEVQTLPESAHGTSLSISQCVDGCDLPPPTSSISPGEIPDEHIFYAPPNFTDEIKEELVRIAKGVPGLREWSNDDWQVQDIAYRGTSVPELKWTHAMVHLELPTDADAPAYCEFGWAASVEINLDTMQVESAYYPVGKNAVCGYETAHPFIE